MAGLYGVYGVGSLCTAGLYGVYAVVGLLLAGLYGVYAVVVLCSAGVQDRGVAEVQCPMFTISQTEA